MTQHMPDPGLTPPPVELIHDLIAGRIGSFGGLQLQRAHFPSGRAPQFHLIADGKPLIAEWCGSALQQRFEAEMATLSALGQPAMLRADHSRGLLLRKPGSDIKLPGLRLLHDPAFAAAVLQECGLKGPFRIDLSAHRLGRRAVLRISHASGVAFARLRSPTSKAARAAAMGHRILWQALTADPRIRLPRPLTENADLGLFLYAALPGRPLRLQGVGGFADIDATAQALQSLQLTTTDAPLWSIEDEIALLNRWHARVERCFPDFAAALSWQVQKTCGDLADLPMCAPVTCHRDLHEGQILLYRGRTGLLDFDTLSRGDPAQDIGNLQAHIDLEALRKNRSLAAYATALERLFRNIPMSRTAVWRRAARLRLAMIWCFSPTPRTTLLALAEDCP